jgi:hypothetical protein
VLNDGTEMEILLKSCSLRFWRANKVPLTFGLILWYGERKCICLKIVLLDIITELHTLLNKFGDFPTCVKSIQHRNFLKS